MQQHVEKMQDLLRVAEVHTSTLAWNYVEFFEIPTFFC